MTRFNVDIYRQKYRDTQTAMSLKRDGDAAMAEELLAIALHLAEAAHHSPCPLTVIPLVRHRCPRCRAVLRQNHKMVIKDYDGPLGIVVSWAQYHIWARQCPEEDCGYQYWQVNRKNILVEGNATPPKWNEGIGRRTYIA